MIINSTTPEIRWAQVCYSASSEYWLEASLMFSGIFLYIKTCKLLGGRRYSMIVFGFAMLLIQGWVFFGPPPASDKAAAVSALLSYAAFGGVAYWLERSGGSAKQNHLPRE